MARLIAPGQSRQHRRAITGAWRAVASLRSALAELAHVALAGGALALVGAALFGKLGSHTTIQQVSPLARRRLGNAALQAPLRQGSDGRADLPAATRPASCRSPRRRSARAGRPVRFPHAADRAGARLRLRDRQGGPHRHELPRRQGRDEGPGLFSGQDQSTRERRRHRSLDRHRRPEDRRARPRADAAPLGNSDAVTVGDSVFAIGNPFGFTRTLTTGVVSALQRQIKAPNTLPIEHAIQTDAAINHGNSGGPLIDVAGRVIGVTSQISTGNTGQQGNIGIGFADPDQHRSQRRRADHQERQGRPCIHRRRRAAGDRAAREALQPADDSRAARRNVTQGQRRRQGGAAPPARRRWSSRVSPTCSAATSSSASTAHRSEFEQLRDAIAQKKPGDKSSSTSTATARSSPSP